MEYREDTDLIDIKSLISMLWNRKYLISSITLFGAIFSVIFALSQNNIYRSISILKPAESYLIQSGTGISSLVSQSPLNLLTGASEVDDKLSFSLERMKNLDFFNNLYVKDDFLVDLYAAKNWDSVTGELEYNKKIYDSNNNKWTRKVNFGSAKPSLQEAHRLFIRSNFSLSLDEQRNFVTLSIDHISPLVAAEWNQHIVNEINNEIKKYDLEKTQNELNFLQENINLSEFASIRDSMAFLMTQKINKISVIESSPNYVFEYVQRAYVPERKYGPSRALICISITLAFFIIAVLFSSILNIYSVNLRKIRG
ncbi:MAG: hypothetical protein CMG62_06300 [Candidatus Marinimicrobia bacterium]|nr:hypothetical protein [Candidatus Neomarinimicrobiota bacterium]|tara:strand:- start:16902 stop:17834 length:933 start_codon:yes stop_codon:yes gene_type:complete